MRGSCDRREAAALGYFPRRSPITERSSSICGQWMPRPRPVISHSARCCGLASASRGNQAYGTESARPSLSSTTNRSASHVTLRARGSNSLTGKVLIPFLQKKGFVRTHDPVKLIQGRSAKTIRPCQPDRRKPEFRLILLALHVNVWRFVTFVAVEEEPEGVYPEDRRHALIMRPGHRGCGNGIQTRTAAEILVKRSATVDAIQMSYERWRFSTDRSGRRRTCAGAARTS